MSDGNANVISSLMDESRRFPPPADVSARAHIKSMAQYQEMYDRSINDPEGFWLEQADLLDWFKKPTVARRYTWDSDAGNVDVNWFEDGELNVSVNCLDRHLENGRADQAAIIWQGEPEDDAATPPSRQLPAEVCNSATVLKSRGPGTGARVRDHAVRVHGPRHAQAVLELRILHGVTPHEQGPRLVDRLQPPSQYLLEHAVGQVLLREPDDVHGRQGRPSHGEDVGERVRGRDPAEGLRVVHDGCEEVHGLDEGEVLPHADDTRVVRGLPAHEKIRVVLRGQPR